MIHGSEVLHIVGHVVKWFTISYFDIIIIYSMILLNTPSSNKNVRTPSPSGY